MRTADILLLARTIGELLTSRNWSLTTAESCTGGLLASTLTEVPGSSAWFEQGIISYSNRVKMQLLSVQPRTLAQYGAVSEEVAKEMAIGAQHSAQAQIAVAVTGIAGPTGGTAEKPAGTVCFAWALPDRLHSARCHFQGNRQAVRLQSVQFAFKTLLQYLQ